VVKIEEVGGSFERKNIPAGNRASKPAGTSGGPLEGDGMMDLIEAHPEWNYHQAEAIRLIGGSEPGRMPENVDRAISLLGRLRALV
jgi:hypothetical protein